MCISYTLILNSNWFRNRKAALQANCRNQDEHIVMSLLFHFDLEQIKGSEFRAQALCPYCSQQTWSYILKIIQTQHSPRNIIINIWLYNWMKLVRMDIEQTRLPPTLSKLLESEGRFTKGTNCYNRLKCVSEFLHTVIPNSTFVILTVIYFSRFE